MSAPWPSIPTAPAWPPRAGTGRSASGTSRRGVQLDQRLGRERAINTLAFSPDGRWIVIGRENGDLFRFDAQGLAAIASGPVPDPADPGPRRGPGRSRPTARRLAVCIKNGREDNIDPMTFSSDVEIRTMPDGNLIRRDRVPGLVQAWRSTVPAIAWPTRAVTPSRSSSAT